MNRFNNIKFNGKDRNVYAGTEFKADSQITADLNSVSAFLTGSSNLYLNAAKVNGANNLTSQSNVNRRFNSMRFNRRDAINYTSINLESKTSFQILQDNISAVIESKSLFTAEASRIRYIKRRFKPRSKLVLKPNAELISNVAFKSGSDFKADIYKYMVSNITFNGTLKTVLTNYRVRFLSFNSESNSRFNLSTFTVSSENLILTSLNFKPNDVIVIDSDNCFVTHNGEDITYKVSGNFFSFYPGENILYWNDNVNERTVRKDIVYQNKYL